MDQEFIILTADADGQLDGAAFFRAPAADGFKAGRSRAVLSGSQQFWVYRVVKGAGKDAALTFEAVSKTADKQSESKPAKKAEKKAK